MAAIEAELQLAGGPVLRYADAGKARSRALRLAADGSLQAFLLAGDASSASWMLDWLQQRHPAATLGRAMLAAGARPPVASAPRSPQVCACHDVSEDAITHALAALPGDETTRLAAVQARLQCGTGCGSCLPAVKALVRRERQPAPAA
jgi:assimilatory nitrate reductase catalytic subunit